MDNEVIHYRLRSTLSYPVYLAEKWLRDTGRLLHSFQQEKPSCLMVFLLIKSTSHIPVGAFACCLQACYLPAQAKNDTGTPGISSQYTILCISPGWTAVLPRELGVKGPALSISLQGIFPECYAPKAFPHSLPGSCLS